MSDEKSQLVMLAAGGTGGHLFPAQALAEELKVRGYDIHLMTDERVRDYGKSFPASRTHIVPSASLTLSDPLRAPGRMLRLYRGYRLARKLIREHKPMTVVGFGGYPSLPPLVAATHEGVASLVHEQNAVLGRANRLLASRVDAVAVSFDAVRGIPVAHASKVRLTGNPVRAAVKAVAAAAYPAIGDKIKLLVFGGSQGAKFFSDVMPPALSLLPDLLRSKLRVVQQCRAEDIERVKSVYATSRIDCELSHFFNNLPELLKVSHLIICRSGASSIAELGVVGRPAILVPLPHALDNDQLRNAESFSKAGGGWVEAQSQLTPARMADLLRRLLEKPQQLIQAAESALRHGRPDAAQRLADLTVDVAARRAAS